MKLKDVETYLEKNKDAAGSVKRKYRIFREYFGFAVSDDRLYVGNTQKGTQIGVYTPKGNKLRDINLQLEKVPCTPADKKEYRESLLEKLGKARYNNVMAKLEMVFPDYFPAYSIFTADKDGIYILTYPRRKGVQKMLVLNKTGKLIKTRDVPALEEGESLCIYNGSYYYLTDNPDTETRELHRLAL
ncbi:MAG: hypothetical protein GY765_20480 [bacterium]|nr:hypothetical protein [bacterium]